MAIKVIHNPEPAPGTLRKPELFALAIGQVIGAGVITLIVPAIKMTGYSAWLAYFVAVLMGFVMILPTVFVSSTLRLGGGNYSMLCGLAGPKIAGIFAYMSLSLSISLSLFGTSASAYIGDIIPALSSPTARSIVAIALLTFFYAVNMMGIDVMAKAQKAMTWMLIAALLVFTIFGIAKIKLPIFDFSDPNFLTNGWGFAFSDDGLISGGFMGAVMLFVYSTNGYMMTISYGGDSKNSKRDIPAVLLMCVPTLCILYVGCAMAGVGATTITEYGESTTLVVAARNLLPSWLFYFFIFGGPIMALLTTLNSQFAYSSINIGVSCDDGWLPKSFGKKNKNGSRVWILTFMYVVGIIPIILGFSITTITNLLQLVSSSFCILNFIAYIKMPKLYNEAWNKSRYHVSNGLYYGICFASLACFILTIWKSCLSMSKSLVVINLVAIAIMVIAAFVCGKKGNIEIHTSVWSGDEAEDKAAAEAITCKL